MTADASAVVAAASEWHERHVAAREALRGVETLVAHAELEAYSVLTRLPAPRRVAPDVAAQHLRRRYPGERLVLSHEGRAQLVPLLGEHGISGGAVYDALIALTAAERDLPLVTADRRALPVYERLGVETEIL